MSIEIYTVTQINRLIKDILESNFYGIWIEGEVSSLRYSSTGHLYFSLIDSNASIGVIIYRNRLNNIKFDIENGMKVVVFGSLGLYVKGGSYRMVVEHIRQSGSGRKFYDLEKLKREFKEQGFFDNKKPIPYNPKNIILITSPNGAAVFDITNILNRRGFGLNLYIYPVVVQGDKAEDSIYTALCTINTIPKHSIDVVILARGGGSNEDLWIFNSPKIAKALFDIKFPTISAIGHEIDYTLCDFVADKRAETPSAAAEIITSSKFELIDKIENYRKTLNNLINNTIRLSKSKIEKYAAKRYLMQINSLINNKLINIDVLSEKISSKLFSKISQENLVVQKHLNIIQKNSPINKIKLTSEKNRMLKYKISQSIAAILSNKTNKVELFDYKFRLANPKNLLKKGYTITADSSGKPIKSALSIKNNQLIKTIFYDGEIISKVKKSKG